MLEKGCVGIWLEGTEMAWDGLATWLWNTGSVPWASWRVMEIEVPRDQAKYKTMSHPTSTSCAGTLQDSFCHDQKGWVQKIKNKKKGWPLLTFWLQNILESRVFQVLWIQFQRYLRLSELSRADQAPLFNFDSEQAFFIEKKKSQEKQSVPWYNLKEGSTFYVQQVFLVLSPWPFFWAQRGSVTLELSSHSELEEGIAEVRLMLKTPPAPPFLTPSAPTQASPAPHQLWSPPSQS